MNQSDLQGFNDRTISLIFRGAFYVLAPVSIPLCVMVLVQNSVIFANYYKDRAKLVAGLFMGIAFADILKAQGELVLSVISILVYSGVIRDETVLYKSLFYYMVTGLVGINWSKLFNAVMTITLTYRVVDPFEAINIAGIRKVLAVLSSVIALLHISDTITMALFIKYSSFLPWELNKAYLYMMTIFTLPGCPTSIAMICYPYHSSASFCDVRRGPYNAIVYFNDYVLGILAFYTVLYCLCIPLAVLVCMIIQIKHLRRSLRDHPDVPAVPNTSRHVSVTVFLVSSLFFFCNIAYFIGVVTYFLLHEIDDYYDQYHDDQAFINMGVFLGLMKFLLPLVYTVAYPIILICRKQELKERYQGYWRRISACCSPNTVE